MTQYLLVERRYTVIKQSSVISSYAPTSYSKAYKQWFTLIRTEESMLPEFPALEVVA